MSKTKRAPVLKYYQLTQRGQKTVEVSRSAVIGVPLDMTIDEEKLDQEKLSDYLDNEDANIVEHSEDDDPAYSYYGGIEIEELKPAEGKERELMMSSRLLLSKEEFDEALGDKEQQET